MNIIVHELVSTLYQTITPSGSNQMVSAIRPHIYKHGAPSGSLTIQVQDNNGRVIKSSDAVAIADISASNYFHGYIQFDVSIGLKLGTTYRIALVPSGGYSFAEANYVGWCNDFDLRKYDADYTPSTGFSAALDMEIWALKEVIKGGAL